MSQLLTRSQAEKKSLESPIVRYLPAIWLMSLAAILLIIGFDAGSNPILAQNSADKAAEQTKSSESENQQKLTTVSVVLGRNPTAFSKPYGFYLNPILEHIHANPDQRTKITAILQSYRGRLEPLRNEYKQKNQELLNKLSHGDKPEEIMNEQTHLGRLYTEITTNYCQMSLEVRKQLDPGQIVLYEEFKRKQGWRSSPPSGAVQPASSK